jgi:hypothetical protein
MSAELKDKVCRTCGEAKPPSDYYASGPQKQYLAPDCKPCQNKATWERAKAKREGKVPAPVEPKPKRDRKPPSPPTEALCGICDETVDGSEWDMAKGCCRGCAEVIERKPEPRIRPVDEGTGYAEPEAVEVPGATPAEVYRHALVRIASEIHRRENGAFVGQLSPRSVWELATAALARADELQEADWAAAPASVVTIPPPDEDRHADELAGLRDRVRALEADRAEIVAAVAPLVEGDEAARQLVRLGMRLAR